MFFKKKKFYNLLDIKNQIVYTPLIFVVILAFVSSFVVYLFFKYQEANKIKLLVQSESFYNQNILKNYIETVNIKTSESVDAEENELIRHVYELKGYTKSFTLRNEALDLEMLKNYMYVIEKTKGVDFLLFDAISYDVLYGADIIEYLREQTSSKINNEKFTNFMLKNIQYNSDDSMTYWIDKEKRKVRLSYFRFIDFKGLMLGIFSRVDDMRALTKQAILESIENASALEEKLHFIFYDENEKSVYNYYGKGGKISAKGINRSDLFTDEKFVYAFPNYNYKIIVKDRKSVV